MITYTFAGLPAADYDAAYEWYVQLLGRPADMFPHASEAAWRLTPNSAIYVVEDPARAGHALVTLAVDDLAAHERRLREAAITFAEQSGSDAPRRIVVTDPDGNTLTFFHAA
jgi:hypothetical protein